MSFAHLHLHTHLSNGKMLDSPSSVEEYCERARELDIKGFAITEHGNMSNWFHKKKIIESYGMKYVHGVEAYISNSLKTPSYHCVLIALNKKGVEELNVLVSDSFERNDEPVFAKERHFYRVPKIFIGEIEASENIIVLSACLGSVFNRMRKGIEDAIELGERLLCWGSEGKLYLEMQPQSNTQQIEYNKYLVQLSKDFCIPLVATNDVHYAREEDKVARDLVQLSSNIVFDNGDEGAYKLHMKSEEEMIDGFIGLEDLDVKEAMNNTVKIFDMVEEFEMDYSPKYPEIYEDTNEEFIERLGEVANTVTDEEFDRLLKEGEIYKKLGQMSYIMMCSDWLKWLRANDIHTGFGRGSVTGSQIAYRFGITGVNSMRWETNLFRFLNPDRVSLADIDLDIPSHQRNKAKSWFYDHPKMNACEVGAFGTWQITESINAMVRAYDKGRGTQLGLELDLFEIDKNEISNMKDKISACGTDKGAKMMVFNGYAQKLIDVDNRYATFFFGVRSLIDKVNSFKNHPCGVVVWHEDLKRAIGFYTTSNEQLEGRPISNFNMNELDELNYIKMDALGLATMEVINNACDIANIDRLNSDSVDYDDEAVWDSIEESGACIFQFSGDKTHTALSKSLKAYRSRDISNFYTMCHCSGIIRPSGASIRDNFVNGEEPEWCFEEISDFFPKTFGYCVSEDTSVLTDDGYKKIKDIKVGDTVLDSEGKNIVNHVFNNGEKELFRIVLSNGVELDATEDHKVLTQEGFVKVSNLDLNYHTVAQRVNFNGERKVSNKYARILGMLCGDGMMTQKRLIRFISNNLQQANEFKSLVEHEFHDCKVVIRKDTYEDKADLYVCNTVNVIKHSNSIKSMLMELIVDGYKTMDGGCGALDKFIPSRVLNGSREEKIHFLSGLLDTDGSITASGHLRFKARSKRLALDLEEILRSIGFTSNIYMANENSFDVTLRNGHILHETLIGISSKASKNKLTKKDKTGMLKLTKRFIQSRVGLSYSREKYPNMTKNEFYSRTKNFKNYTTAERIIGTDLESYLNFEPMNNMSLETIQSITPIGIGKVYDIEVNNSHNYIANGIIVHNCIYQEDIMNFLVKFCGYSGSESDSVRRKIAKKKKEGYDEMLKEISSRFRSTMWELAYEKFGEEECDGFNGEHIGSMIDDDLEYFIKIVEDSQNYAFSWNHSMPYTSLGYISAWLRHHHPTEFFTAYLNAYKGEDDKMSDAFSYIEKYTDVKLSTAQWGGTVGSNFSADIDSKIIHEGLSDIKGANKDIADRLKAMPKTNYNSFVDFLEDSVEVANVGNKNISTLIKIDFFREFGGQVKLLNVLSEFFEGKNKYTKKLAEKSKVKRLIALREFEALEPNEDRAKIDKFMSEVEYIGKSSVEFDNVQAETYLVESVSRAFSNYWCELYDLNTKQHISVRYSKKNYDNIHSIEEGSFIRITDSGVQYKKIKEDGKWVETDVTYTQMYQFSDVVFK